MSATQDEFTPDMGNNAIDLAQEVLNDDEQFLLLFIDVVNVADSFSKKFYNAFHKSFNDFAKARQEANDAFRMYHGKIEDFRTLIRERAAF